MTIKNRIPHKMIVPRAIELPLSVMLVPFANEIVELTFGKSVSSVELKLSNVVASISKSK